MDRLIHEQRGAAAVLFGIIVMVLMFFTALAVDMAGLRSDTRSNQTVADFAATSGALDLDPLFGGSPYKACQSAWGFFLANTQDVPKNAPDPCAPFMGMSTCDVNAVLPTPVEATGTVGPYQVSIKYPILDGDPAMLGRLETDIDGHACYRIGVSVKRLRDHNFAGVMNAATGESNGYAVARTASSDGTGEGVALVVLDPTGCRALVAKGQAQVKVRGVGNTPGIITVDSAGTETNSAPGDLRNCSNTGQNGDFTIDAEGTQNSSIIAEDGVDESGNPVRGVIFSHALMPGLGNGFSYQPSDVTDGRLYPRPAAGERVTRSPIDWRYNCKASNFCREADTSTPHIDNLRALVGTSGAPMGFGTYPDDIAGAKCNLPSSASPVTLTGNWFINCAKFENSTTFTIVGGNVVFGGNVNIGGSGSLVINNGGAADRWVYIRAGNLEKDAQSSLILDRTFVYIHDGAIDLKAGTGALTWVAPYAGNFEDLALWSESSLQHNLGGQTVLNIEGVFFAPGANRFNYAGQGEQRQAKAQFIAYRIEITGQGALIMEVDPTRSVLIPLHSVRLIR